MDRIELFANLGGEESDGWRKLRKQPPVDAARRAWASLFTRNAVLDAAPASTHDTPAFDWLPSHGPGLVAWWPSIEAQRAAEDAKLPWLGPEPEIAAAVHDKAFAARHAPAIPGAELLVLDPEALRDPTAPARIARALEGWSEPRRARFCLKPRFGSSGRGRVEGRDGRADTDAIRAALPRLASRGGAILEPWLERIDDFSVSFHIADDAGDARLELLGSLRALTSRSGVPVGHCGEIDSRGRVDSGSRFEPALREAATELALLAASGSNGSNDRNGHGARGPCGVDAFTYRDGDTGVALRPIVELNARFTLGIVALGCVRRARAALRNALALEPGERASFAFLPMATMRESAGGDVVVLRDESAPSALILASREREALDASLRDALPG